MPDEDKDEWRVFYQKLPVDLHDKWKVQLRRIALANGISPQSWDLDSKFDEHMGPRVMTMEALLILIARTDEEYLRI